MIVGTVREIWRYPVKSMRGERVDAAAVDATGLIGDRRWAVYDADGHIGSGKITRRFRPIAGLRAHSARLDGEEVAIETPDGGVVSSGGGCDDALSASFGQPVTLATEGAVPHQDAAPVHLLSSASLAWASERVGRPLDAFEFRPNILFDTGLPWPAEENWCGRVVQIGEAVRLRIVERTERCIMVDAKRDGRSDGRVAQVLALANDACLGVYAEVVAAGEIRCGDAMVLA